MHNNEAPNIARRRNFNGNYAAGNLFKSLITFTGARTFARWSKAFCAEMIEVCYNNLIISGWYYGSITYRRGYRSWDGYIVKTYRGYEGFNFNLCTIEFLRNHILSSIYVNHSCRMLLNFYLSRAENFKSLLFSSRRRRVYVTRKPDVQTHRTCKWVWRVFSRCKRGSLLYNIWFGKLDEPLSSGFVKSDVFAARRNRINVDKYFYPGNILWRLYVVCGLEWNHFAAEKIVIERIARSLPLEEFLSERTKLSERTIFLRHWRFNISYNNSLSDQRHV